MTQMGNEAVRDGYEQIAATYAAQRDQFKSLPYLERFVELLPPDGMVLDVGCGAGKPVDEFLVEHGYTVHGLDLSARMIELARANVPQATYEMRDMLDLKPGEYRVDGIVSFYAIFHTPREHHEALLSQFASFLPQGGAILITMGESEWEGVEDFLGAPMSWSHYGAERNRELVERAGFHVLLDEIDRSANEAHQVILGRLERPGVAVNWHVQSPR